MQLFGCGVISLPVISLWALAVRSGIRGSAIMVMRPCLSPVVAPKPTRDQRPGYRCPALRQRRSLSALALSSHTWGRLQGMGRGGSWLGTRPGRHGSRRRAASWVLSPAVAGGSESERFWRLGGGAPPSDASLATAETGHV